jgi:hypothetical protein
MACECLVIRTLNVAEDYRLWYVPEVRTGIRLVS